jgi:hypothetical protein
VLVAAIAAGHTAQDAAKAADVGESTVYRRLRDADFKRQVDEARDDMLAQTVARLTSASVEAVEALRGLLASPLDFARLGAARAILEVGLKYREQHDLAARVAALETLIAEKEGRSWPARTA